MLLTLIAAAWAVDTTVDDQVRTEEKTLSEYLTDLTRDDDSKRLYAARIVWSRLKTSLRVVERAKEGTLAFDDARIELLELEARIPDACRYSLQFENTVALCADMLGWLDVTVARPDLELALTKETRRSVRTRIEGALASIPTTQAP